MLSKLGITPDRIILECPIQQAYTDNTSRLIELVRSIGIKTGLDTCAVNDAFSWALNVLEPEFIKVNRSFFGADERTPYSAGVLETVMSDASRIGTRVIGQGVESEEESIRLLSAGVELQQGYYYTKDENAQPGSQAESLLNKIEDANRKYRDVKGMVIRQKKEQFTQIFRVVLSACSKFESISEADFEDGCKALVRKADEITSVFIVNDKGVQITPRVHNGDTKGTVKSSDLGGMRKGADHSVKDYILYLDMGYTQFVTDPFASPFADSMSCLISRPFYDHLGARYKLCIEMSHPG